MSEPRRILVTLHYPLDMHMVAVVLKEVARAYPHAVVGENGTIWSEPGASHAELTSRFGTAFLEPQP